MKIACIPFLVLIAMASSCSKSSDDVAPIVVNKPKLGTTWTYQYDKFKADGVMYVTTTSKHKATSEVTLGGETWLNITDDTLGLVYVLNVKTGGLYQYDNGASNLLCKMPATVNDTYTAYNRGGTENFTVKQTGISIGSANGSSYDDVTMYEGYQGAELWDKIWYNETSWFARRETWFHDPYAPFTYRKQKRYILLSVTY